MRPSRMSFARDDIPGGAPPQPDPQEAPTGPIGPPLRPPATAQSAREPTAGGGSPARRAWGLRRRRPEAERAPAAGGPGAGGEPEAGRSESPGELRRRRKRIVEERELALFHLGGLAVELRRRELLPEGPMRTRADQVAAMDESLHEIDARLEELAAERRERGRRPQREDFSGTVGNCLACRAPFSTGARFCWQCGTRLAPKPPDAQDTGVIPRPPELEGHES
jgi:hypothetical protein